MTAPENSIKILESLAIEGTHLFKRCNVHSCGVGSDPNMVVHGILNVCSSIKFVSWWPFLGGHGFIY